MQKGGDYIMYADAEEQIKEEQIPEQHLMRLATVSELFPIGTAKIRFFGELEDSEKEYSYLSSYKPVIDDTVVLSKVGNTWIIMGKVLFQAVEEKEVVVEKNYLELNSNGVFSVDDTGWYNNLYSINIKKNLQHAGNLGFFGTKPTTKKSLTTVRTSESTSMATCLGYINNIVSLLNRYGLA